MSADSYQGEATENGVVAALAQDAVTPEVLNPALLYGTSNPLHVLDLEAKLANPRRKRGAASFRTAKSLVDYCKVHSMNASSTLWADISNTQVIAVFDGHALDVAGWGEHTGTLMLQISPEWRRWKMHDGQLQSPEAFAELLENQHLDLVEPDAASMLEIATTINVKKDVEFRNHIRLANGDRKFTYDETVTGSAGAKGDITIPETFTLGLRVFDGADVRHRVEARLRYRLHSGKLSIGYIMNNPADVVERAWQENCEYLARETGLPVYDGTPPR